MTVYSLDEYRGDAPSDITLLMNQTWPRNRKRGDFRREIRDQAELELRVTYCGFCGAKSKKLDGPAGREWFAHHTTSGACSQRVVA